MYNAKEINQEMKAKGLTNKFCGIIPRLPNPVAVFEKPLSLDEQHWIEKKFNVLQINSGKGMVTILNGDKKLFAPVEVEVRAVNPAGEPYSAPAVSESMFANLLKGYKEIKEKAISTNSAG